MRGTDEMATPQADPAGGEALPRRPAYARGMATTNEVTRQFLAVPGADCILLAGGLPAPEVYPLQAIEAATGQALRRFGADAAAYGPVEGLAELREAIAGRLSAGGRRFGAENILVTTGSMQALELIGKVLIDPGDVIVAQYPTYLGALDAWRPRLPRYRRIDWDADAAALARSMDGAKFAYAVPNFSNPTGALVPAADRARLLRAAAEAGVWLVEDDPYGALYYDGDALPSVLDLDAGPTNSVYRGNVAYLGTLSKTLAPGLRVGWVVGDPALIQALSLAKQSTDLCGSAFAQAVACELLRARVDQEQVPRIRALYRRRRDAICDAARRHLADRFTFAPPQGGMFLWLTAKDPGLDTDALTQAAMAEGVSVCPSSAFDPAGANRTAVRLNFTFNDERLLGEGVRRLARAVARL